MITEALRERLAQDIGAWLTDGLVSQETYHLLRQRYEARRFGIAGAIKYLGISGGLIAFFGLLGLVGAIGGELVGAFLLLSVGGALTAAGVWLSIDPLARYPASSKVVLTLGVVAESLGIGMVVHLIDPDGNSVGFVTGLIALPAVWYLAYRFQNIFLLILGLIGFFHWVGSWTAMWGRSTYEVSIQDPRLMCGASLAAVGIGLWHELRLRERTGRFYQAYEARGLTYLNLSLLILSIIGDFGRHVPSYAYLLIWIGLFAAAGIAQIVAGAWLHNGLFTGFGVTALAVNIYTRYYEHCWERMHQGLFFLVGGLALFTAGFGCELLLQRLRRTTKWVLR